MSIMKAKSPTTAQLFIELAKEILRLEGSVLTAPQHRSIWAGGVIDFSTHYGPSEQDKECNQDYALGWTPHDSSTSGFDWAIVLADGVSSSWHSELAARLACWSSLAALVSCDLRGVELAGQACCFSGRIIAEVAREVESDSETYRPEGEFSSMWNHTLRKGVLLQTTLTIAWMRDSVVHVGIVGDGGGLIECRSEENGGPTKLGPPNYETNRVHAIGPKNPEPRLDHYDEFDVDGPFVLALYTDGAGKGLDLSKRSVLEEFRDRKQSDTEVVTNQLIEEWIDLEAESFDDNLTLAIVTGDAKNGE